MKNRTNSMVLGCSILALAMLAGTTASAAESSRAAGVSVSANGAGNVIRLSDGRVVATTQNPVANAKVTQAVGMTIVTWQELENGQPAPYYSLSRGGEFSRVLPNPTVIDTQIARFDPVYAVPSIPANLAVKPVAGDNGIGAYIVQFIVPPTQEFYDAVNAIGADIGHTMHDNGRIVTMTPGAAAAVAQLPFVRWVGDYHPAYKLELPLVNAYINGTDLPAVDRYSVMLVREGEDLTGEMEALLQQVGQDIVQVSPRTARIEAFLTPAQFEAVINSPYVLFVDRRGEPGHDMDIIRQINGANQIETAAGYNGSGVRGEAADTQLNAIGSSPSGGVTHTNFVAPGLGGAATLSPIVRAGGAPSGSHGTAVYSICFGDGNPSAQMRGNLPLAQGYFSHSNHLLAFSGNPAATNTVRQAHTDGSVALQIVFQTNSTGDSQITTYSTISADTDTILFNTDFLMCQSQSNLGTQSSRPQAWAKNMVSVGGLNIASATRSTHSWATGASQGPASDGRVKPDLSGAFGGVFSAWDGSSTASTDFSGTSSATPTQCSTIGLIFEMWADGIFGNTVGGGSVFAERPHAMTAKALAINTAWQYNWAAGGSNANMWRCRQGWGHADAGRLYDMRNKIFVVDEDVALLPLGTHSYCVNVAAGEPLLKITMAYLDRAGNPANQAQHRVNDLSLKVTSPGGVIYWGNGGLWGGGNAVANTGAPFSVAGGVANTKDTVENVFLANPQAGDWTVEIQGNSITVDARLETPGVIDADYGLVVTGAIECDAGCDPDLTTGAIPGQPGYGVPNGILNNDDFFYYLAQFSAGNLAVADLTTGAIPGQPGYGVPNGVINNDDFFYYLSIYSAGC